MSLDNEHQHLDAIVRHIRKVQDNCLLMGKRLIDLGQVPLGRQLIANGMVHDNSKFFGCEWQALRPGTDAAALAVAVDHHNRSNKHHPEAWGGIANMPRVYLAEAVCDWAARSSEFGLGLVDWVEGEAPKRFGFRKGSRVHKQIKYFMNILLDPAFTPIR